MLKIKNCGLMEFSEKNEDNNVFCFGAGKNFQKFNTVYNGVWGIVDNYRSGESIRLDNGKQIRIVSLREFVSSYKKNKKIVLVITCSAYDEIINQLDEIKELDGMMCYLDLFLMMFTDHYKQYPISLATEDKIPKKIHYCWFGRGQIPAEYSKYMESWRKYCPDYEIVRWDETNYDVDKNEYLREMYKNKQWAFVSDYARIDILYKYGGIYLDTDVELLRGLDEFLKWDMFCGFEDNQYVAWGLGVGAVAGHKILKNVLEAYEHIPIYKDNATLNLINCPIIQTAVIKQYGFEINGTPQLINNVAVYPKEFFAPFSYINGFGNTTSNTYSIHHYSANWMDEETRNGLKKLEAFSKRIYERTESEL